MDFAIYSKNIKFHFSNFQYGPGKVILLQHLTHTSTLNL